MFGRSKYDQGYERGQNLRDENPHLKGRALDKWVVQQDMSDKEEAGFYDGYRDEEYTPFGYHVDVENGVITPAEPQGFFHWLFG
jgi:hypothetical protein